MGSRKVEYHEHGCDRCDLVEKRDSAAPPDEWVQLDARGLPLSAQLLCSPCYDAFVVFMAGPILRDTVRWFAEKMEARLAANDDRDGWADEDDQYLMDRLGEETRELVVTLAQAAVSTGLAQEVVHEAADVANFAMMIADNHHQAEAGP
jgi:hypothetical protein